MLTAVLFVLGIVLLVTGAEILVRGASSVAVGLGISPLVVGLTVVAFGTSSPELSVSLISAWSGTADLAVGNVVGSNIANVLLILGLCAAITPLYVAQQLIRLDVPLMIAASFLMLILARDELLGRWDGLLLFTGAVAYTAFAVVQSRKETKAIAKEYDQEFGGSPRTASAWVVDILSIVGGLALLVLGSRWLVNGAVAVAQSFGISQLVIGLTVVAVGTSLPEVATSVIASLRGERDIAVGNVVGSNLFNILLVLGLTASIAPGGVPVSLAALRFDMPVMIAVSVACLPVFFTGNTIQRWEGFVFLGYYVAYTAYLVLGAVQHDAIGPFSAVMLWFVMPLTAVTLVVLMWRAARGRNA